MMNPLLESLLVPEGATYTYFHRRLDERIPFVWHYHREIELTLTLNSLGQRYVGESIESYGDGDLVLLGANLPHTWMSQSKCDESAPHVAHVFWIRASWLESLIDTLIELSPLRATLLNAARGMVFSPAVSATVRSLVVEMDRASPPKRLVQLIEVLTLLAADAQFRLLCAPGEAAASFVPSDRPRIERALNHIHQHYVSSDISIALLADLAALSVSGLHRLFKRHTRQTVNEYVSQLRIGKACSLLISSDRPVAIIAEESGYQNLSHFNRQFLAIKGVTPREFRRSFAEPAAMQPAPSAAAVADESPVMPAAEANAAIRKATSSRRRAAGMLRRVHPTGLAAVANSDL